MVARQVQKPRDKAGGGAVSVLKPKPTAEDVRTLYVYADGKIPMAECLRRLEGDLIVQGIETLDEAIGELRVDISRLNNKMEPVFRMIQEVGQ